MNKLTCIHNFLPAKSLSSDNLFQNNRQIVMGLHQVSSAVLPLCCIQIFHWCWIFLMWFVIALLKRLWAHETGVLRHVILAFQLFVEEMKQTDR